MKNNNIYILLMPGPDVWGPHGWKFIHYITLGYPNYPTDIDKKRYYDFFTSLKFVIPCSLCASHFQNNLLKYPLSDTVLANKQNLIEWGINMHNMVNLANNKKILTYDEGLYAILNNIDSCSEEQMTNTNIINNYCLPFWIVTLFCLILLLFIFVKLYKK